MLQTLNLGNINFKVYYRKLLMRYILAKIETCSSAQCIRGFKISECVACTIRWVAEAWKNIIETTKGK